MGPHLDAEHLAAFVDGSLSRAERAACEAHAADCPRCLQLLAAMARIDSGVPKPSRPWSRVPAVLRWGVPLAAGATALALWVNVQTQRSQPPSDASVAAPERSIAPSQPAVAPSAPPPAPTALQDATDKSAGRSVREEKRESRRASSAPSDAKAVENPSAKAVTPPEVPREQRLEVPVGQPVALPTVPTSETAKRVASAPPPPPVAAPGAAAAPPAAASETAARLRVDALDRRTLKQSGTVVEVRSPDPSIRWRALGAAILRSTDGGKTWTTQSVSPRVELLSGSSPSSTVAWLVGRAGGVLLCADAGECRRLSFPEAVDLTAVRAQSELQADVTTADGRVFATSDGGKTWTRK